MSDYITNNPLQNFNLPNLSGNQTSNGSPSKSTPKSSGGSSQPSQSIASSFNYGSIGISTDVWNSLGSDGQAALSVAGKGILNIIKKNQPLPTILDSKEMNKLWKEALNDPVINKFYAEDLRVGSDFLTKNMDLMSSDYQMLTDKEKQDYVDAKKNLEETYAAAGTAYSGFRKQAQTEQDKNTQDVITSSRNQYQANLNSLEQTFEQKYGSKALADLNVKPLTAGTTTPVGMQSNWTLPTTDSVSYTPIGDLEGTNATEKLKDEIQKQQDLASEEVQDIGLENIKREKKQKEALDKLK